MRIVSGRHRGRPLLAPEGRALRPTADRVRQAIFNILEHGLGGAGAPLDGAVALDVFAGTGAMGLEALSRGAAKVVFIDRDEAALGLLRRNVAALGEQKNVLLLRLDAANLPPPPRAAGTPAAYAFLDAPYNSGLSGPALACLKGRGWIGPGAIAVIEIAAREPFAPPPGFAVLDERAYGSARVVFAVVAE